MMKPATHLAVLFAAVLAAGCGSSANTESASTQENFGVRMAKINLWREALFRFQRAVQLNPQDAMAHNNLAVAYEANGDFDNAAKEYREAMRLDKSNQYIQKNYSRLVEFMSRNKKRQQQQKTAGAPAATTPQTSAAPGATPVAAPPTTPPMNPAPSPAPTSAQPTVTPAPPNPPQPQPPPPSGGITA